MPGTGIRRSGNPNPNTGSTKKRRTKEEQSSRFEALAEEILFMILDRLDLNPLDKKSFSLVCKSFYSLDSRHRRTLRPLRIELLPDFLRRYPSVSRLDLTLCPRVTDGNLSAISLSLRSSLLAIDLSRSILFTHVGLESLVSNCSALVEIDLSNATDLSDAAAAAIGRARNLERLSLTRCKRISDMGIGCIAVGCPNLRFLCLKWCLGVTDLGVGLVAIKCKQLRSLDLSYVPISKKCLPAIFKLRYLQDLSLVGCGGLEDDGLKTVELGCKSLEILNMSNCEHVSDFGLSYLTSGTVNLRQLILAYWYPVTHSLGNVLQNLPKLQSLVLDGCQVTCSGLESIGNSCISLKELSLSKCLGVTDEGLSSLVGKQKELMKLDITCCRKITDASISSITASCSSLKSLRMESCNLISKEAFILIGQHCHLLEELDLTDNELDNEALKAISKCFKLSCLKIGICLNVSDEGLYYIGMRCSGLTELDLYRSVGVTDYGVAAIAHGCPRLQLINLAYCTEITDDSLRSLSKCSKLNTLEIRGCSRVSSVGLSAIAGGCKQITKLDIKKCYDVNDAGVLPFAHFSQNLRQVNLSYCSVTDAGLLALASVNCLQNLTILHVSGLTSSGLAATLLACEGLTKVKLHALYKSRLPPHLIERIEARGCLFQWRDKPFKAEVDHNKSWKLQAQEMYNMIP